MGDKIAGTGLNHGLDRAGRVVSSVALVQLVVGILDARVGAVAPVRVGSAGVKGGNMVTAADGALGGGGGTFGGKMSGCLDAGFQAADGDKGCWGRQSGGLRGVEEC